MTITTIPQADPTGELTNIWRELDFGCTFNLATLAASGLSLDSSDVGPSSIMTFNSDKTKLYLARSYGIYPIESHTIIYQYSLTTPGDIISAVYDYVKLDIVTPYGDKVRDIVISPDGLKLFVAIDDTITEYDLGTSDLISSAVASGVTFAPLTGSYIVGISISLDGLSLYIAYGLTIFQYALDSAHSLASVALVNSVTDDYVADSWGIAAMEFNAAEDRVYLIVMPSTELIPYTIVEYSITGGDITTLTLTSKTYIPFSSGPVEIYPKSMLLDDSNCTLYVIDAWRRVIYQHS